MTTSLETFLSSCYAPIGANYGGDKIMQFNDERSRYSEAINVLIRHECETSNGMKYLSGLMRRYAGANALDYSYNLHPDHIKKICYDFNLSTVEDVLAFIAANDNVNAESLFLDISNTVPQLPPLREATFGSFIERLLAAPNQNYHPDLFRGNAWISDNTYQMLTDEALDILCAACPANKFQWLAEKRDCDDFTRMVRGWLSSSAYGNVTVFDISLYGLDADGSIVAAHSALLCITETKVVIWEGQTGYHNYDRNYYPQAIGVGNQFAVGNQIYRIDL